MPRIDHTGTVNLLWRDWSTKILPKIAPSYIKLKKEFTNSDLGGVDNCPDK